MSKQSRGRQRSKQGNSVRLTVQIIFLVITLLIGLRHIMPGESSKGGAFDAFCPFGAIETLWPYMETGQTLKTTSPLNFSILLGVLGVSVLAGRAFCGWMCPVGTLQDLLADISDRIFRSKKMGRQKPSLALPIRISEDNTVWLRMLKYLILLAILVTSTWSVYPPLRDICPARALFSFQLNTPLLGSVLITFLVTSLVNRRVWCKYLCPLGAVLAPFNKTCPLRLVLIEENCTDCGGCDSVCPMDIKDLPHHLRSSECIQCLDCQQNCTRQNALELRLG